VVEHAFSVLEAMSSVPKSKKKKKEGRRQKKDVKPTIL
jgi:hypothetical protein